MVGLTPDSVSIRTSALKGGNRTRGYWRRRTDILIFLCFIIAIYYRAALSHLILAISSPRHPSLESEKMLRNWSRAMSGAVVIPVNSHYSVPSKSDIATSQY